MITGLTFQDIDQVVKLHKQELSGFLSELGESFLKKFYRQSLSIPELFTFTIAENEQILGFVTGTTTTKGLYRRIIFTDILGFIFIFVNYFITHPSKIMKAMQVFAYPGFVDDSPELLTIAIGKKRQKKGFGRKLFEKTVAEFKRRRVKSFKISAYTKLSANGFYKKMGCKLESSFMFLGEKMNYWVKDCPFSKKDSP